MLNTVINNIYEEQKQIIIKRNIKDEEEKLGLSYEAKTEEIKNKFKSGNVETFDHLFLILHGVYYFNNAQDLMYKQKIKADNFFTTPLEAIILPQMKAEITSLFNDVHVIPENHNRETNIKIIKSIIKKYIDFNSLLFLLYYCNWQFSKDWKVLFPDSAEELETMVENSKITIEDFLNALIEHKIENIRNVVSAIKNTELNNEYMQRVKTLRDEQLKKVSEHVHSFMPVGYLKNHTISDFMQMEKPALRSVIIPK